MAVTKTRIRLGDEKTTTCPSCGHRQIAVERECEACGLIFSKHLGFTPTKVLTSGSMSAKKIAELRKTNDMFTKVKHDTTSKMELLIHCHKEDLMDMAAYHTGPNNSDDKVKQTIKNLTLGKMEKEHHSIIGELFSSIFKPLIIIPLVLLVLLLLATLFLRSYI